jgi:two-component system response regulator YesN
MWFSSIIANVGRLAYIIAANELHLNKAYLSLRFKQLFGTSSIQMHRHLKLERAKLLLSLGEMSVTEIGEALGFTEVAHFSRFFKSSAGISPKNYRNNSI